MHAFKLQFANCDFERLIIRLLKGIFIRFRKGFVWALFWPSNQLFKCSTFSEKLYLPTYFTRLINLNFILFTYFSVFIFKELSRPIAQEANEQNAFLHVKDICGVSFISKSNTFAIN